MRPSEIAAWVHSGGDPTFRGRQVAHWVFRRGALTTATMANLPAALRQRLAASCSLARPRVDTVQVSVDGTRKYRLVATDGTAFEAVYIPEVARGRRSNSLCVSSQSGCAVGCRFCFTASLRRNRNLSAAEIVGQVMAVQADLTSLGAAAQVTNVVYMGMGEPLLNYDHLVQSARILLDPEGLGFSSRRVTISTSGIVPRLRTLGHDLPTQLAVSLNATTDAIRTRIMPINKKWPLAVLLQALRDYPLPPRRRITIEYVLLGGVNDAAEDAERLIVLLQNLPVKVNLLPLNVHDRTELQAPTAAAVARFQDILRAAGMNALCRTPRGQDIAAACGQLGEAAGQPTRPGSLPLAPATRVDAHAPASAAETPP